jgi:hypothetical protein
MTEALERTRREPAHRILVAHVHAHRLSLRAERLAFRGDDSQGSLSASCQH